MHDSLGNKIKTCHCLHEMHSIIIDVPETNQIKEHKKDTSNFTYSCFVPLYMQITDKETCAHACVPHIQI